MLASLPNNNVNTNGINISSSSSSSSAALLNNRQIATSQLPLLNVQLAKQQQQRLLGTSPNDAGNLSPAILLHATAPPISINNTTTVRLPSPVTPATTAAVAAPVVASAPVNVTPLATQIKVETSTTTSPIATQESTETPTPPPLGTCANEKKCTHLGDYQFFEPTAPTDSFGAAFNIKTNQSYLWKKFDQRDYMKKLEPYFVMEGTCDKIYKHSGIILQSQYESDQQQQQQQQPQQKDAVYVIFEPHYGDLHSFMKEKKRLDETEARHVFRQVVESVVACHENGIIIRDIKLKKFVFLDPERTKIGLANLEDCLLLDEDAENDLIKSQQGCPAYVSPEVLNPFQTSYSGKLSDSWSLGIILYTLLVGRYPFHHPTIANMFARIARGKFQLPMSIPLSMDARILLRSLIRVKPDERLRPDEILAHNWFRQNENERRPAAAAASVRLIMNGALHHNLSNYNHHCAALSSSANASPSSAITINKIQLGLGSTTGSSSSSSSSSSSLSDDLEDCCVPQMQVQ